jgi:hypothetical protein
MIEWVDINGGKANVGLLGGDRHQADAYILAVFDLLLWIRCQMGFGPYDTPTTNWTPTTPVTGNMVTSGAIHGSSLT